MKTSLYAIVLLSFIYFGHAQEGEINIQQDKRIEDLLALYRASNENGEFYRIQVGFGTFQLAQKIKSQVDIDFPDWYSKIDFESPSYRVRVGRFRTKLEAEKRLIEVRKKYPEAMLLKPEKTTS